MVADTPKLPMLHANNGQEIGIMVGFIALFIIVTAVFSVLWSSKNKRHDKLEVDRQRELKEAGWGLNGWDRLGKDKRRNGNGLGGVMEHAENVDVPEQQQEKPQERQQEKAE
ncbi:hypothetical protein V496_07806 [Pseudogymnoascus sp. VKM F-4515 (FW-2607)]|nr:hypothetical protein V496_07806 [Pseudogymnoascus sp. VKM F-4515 (FW-2607)]KFY96715.1 hypothetical protein V498_02518 [Pseudogymnoascus sp. VKM F-4517 (FW-2822)]